MKAEESDKFMEYFWMAHLFFHNKRRAVSVTLGFQHRAQQRLLPVRPKPAET